MKYSILLEIICFLVRLTKDQTRVVTMIDLITTEGIDSL